jgi:hypothetical protein
MQTKYFKLKQSLNPLKVHQHFYQIFTVLLCENKLGPLRQLCSGFLSTKGYSWGWGQGGEMTQALYAHMNNKIKKKTKGYSWLKQ